MFPKQQTFKSRGIGVCGMLIRTGPCLSQGAVKSQQHNYTNFSQPLEASPEAHFKEKASNSFSSLFQNWKQLLQLHCDSDCAAGSEWQELFKWEAIQKWKDTSWADEYRKVNHLHLLFFCHIITVFSSCQTCTTDTESHPCLQQSTRGRLFQPPWEALILLSCWDVLHRFHPGRNGASVNSKDSSVLQLYHWRRLWNSHRIFLFLDKKSIYCTPLPWDTITAS